MKPIAFPRSALASRLAPWRRLPATLLCTASLLAATQASAVMLDFSTVPHSYPNIWPHTIGKDGSVLGALDDGQRFQLFAWSPGQGFKLLTEFPFSTGTVVGVSRTQEFMAVNARDSAGVLGAYRWDLENGFVNLGDLGGVSPRETTASGISDDGKVIVGWSRTGPNYRAFLWTAGAMQNLGALPGDISSFAHGVSGDGLVVVGQGDSRAFRWDATSGMIDLGTLGGNSLARATNHNGDVVVGFSQKANQDQAFRWTASGGMVNLGTLGGAASDAYDVNADGSVVVGEAQRQDNAKHAFRWTEAGGMVDLGVLSGASSSGATAVSDDGNTVFGTSGSRYFIWSAPATVADGVMQDLAYLQTSVIRSAGMVNQLISTQNRRLRDLAQTECLPGGTQTYCLGFGLNGYRGEADTDGNQRNAAFNAGLRLNEQFSIGANLSLGRADLRERSAQQRDASAFGLWAAYQQSDENLGWGARASVANGSSNNRFDRGVGLDDVQRAQSKVNIDSTAVRVALNYGLQLGATQVTPEVALSHVRTGQDGFTERDVALPLTISSSDSRESYATFAVRSATPVSAKGTLHLSLAVDTLLNEDTAPIEGRSAVPGLSRFHLDSTLNKRTTLPTATAGYSHALSANSTLGGGVQVTSATYEGQQPVFGVGVQYRYAF